MGQKPHSQLRSVMIKSQISLQSCSCVDQIVVHRFLSFSCSFSFFLFSPPVSLLKSTDAFGWLVVFFSFSVFPHDCWLCLGFQEGSHLFASGIEEPNTEAFLS